MTATDVNSPPMANTPEKKKEWAPRIWQGCEFFAWIKLLAKNHFAVSLPYLYIAVIVTFVSMMHTLLRLVQNLLYGNKIRRTAVNKAPIFIIGHWRTGTTLLHELMIQDPRHGFPTTYECMAPNHFLLTEKLFTRLFWFLVPKHRPMDNMKAGYDRPQEDEFAMCMLGQPSPYLTIAFPNRPPQYQEYFDLEKVPPRKLAKWKLALMHFIQQITLKTGKRIILKSPPHTCRIKVLKELFPNALFVHIMRDPYVVYPSTVNLWKTLYRTHGLQTPRFVGLEDYVFETGLHLYDRLEETRSLLGAGQFHELRYEDLVKDPIGQMRKLYDHFQLGGFAEVIPRMEAYLAETRDYKTNRYQLTPELRQEITRRWRTIINRYGYAMAENTST